jgi:hypothetical protein
VTPLNKNFSGPLIAPSGSAPAGADSTVSCSFIWSSEKYPLFDGKLSRPIFFFGVPTHDLLANDDGSELCSCLGPRSPTGTIASRKTRGAPRRRGRISLFIRECLPVARSLARLYIPRWWIEHRIRDGNALLRPSPESQGHIARHLKALRLKIGTLILRRPRLSYPARCG